MGQCIHTRRVCLTSWSFLRSRLAMVQRRTVNLPRSVVPHMCVKPRKSKVSGFPWPRLWRRSLAQRPNSIFHPSRDRIQRVVRAASWAGTVREPEKFFLVDGVEHLDCRPLDDVVFQCRLTDGALAPIGFRYGDALDRWGLLGSPLQAV
jgi:hypothetical protein